MAANQNVNAAPLTTDGRHPAKSVLKEAVDAVLNSFAKHTQGYGAGTPLAACFIGSDASLHFKRIPLSFATLKIFHCSETLCSANSVFFCFCIQ